jgi:hypothetical protein
LSRNKLRENDVEKLLRCAFRDDMPAELEEEMLRRFETFWFRASHFGTMHRVGIATARHAFLLHLFTAPGLRRFLLAASALVMLIAGGTLRIGQTSSYLADSIALKQIAMSVSLRLHHAHQMYSELETQDGRGNPLRFSIMWAEGTPTSVQIHALDGNEVISVTTGSIRTSVISLSEGIPAGKSTRTLIQDERLKPILDFLTPPALARFLAGEWHSAAPSTEEGKDVVEYDVLLPGGDRVALVTVDQGTLFPAALAVFSADSWKRHDRSKALLRARFQWRQTPVPARMPR